MLLLGIGFFFVILIMIRCLTIYHDHDQVPLYLSWSGVYLFIIVRSRFLFMIRIKIRFLGRAILIFTFYVPEWFFAFWTQGAFWDQEASRRLWETNWIIIEADFLFLCLWLRDSMKSNAVFLESIGIFKTRSLVFDLTNVWHHWNKGIKVLSGCEVLLGRKHSQDPRMRQRVQTLHLKILVLVSQWTYIFPSLFECAENTLFHIFVIFLF